MAVLPGAPGRAFEPIICHAPRKRPVAPPYYRGRVHAHIPPEGEDPVRVRTEIRWRNAAAAVTIQEVFFYSTGVYIPVTYRTLPARPPARQAETEEHDTKRKRHHPIDPAEKRP